MTVKLNIEPDHCCEKCGNVYSFNIQISHLEQSALRRLDPGKHKRKFDGYCGQCGEYIGLRCVVTVEADGQKIIT